MKFAVLLTVLPALCVPVAGSPLRGPSEILISLDPESRLGPVATDLTSTPPADEPYSAPDTRFFSEGLPDTSVSPGTVSSIDYSFDSTSTFGPTLIPAGAPTTKPLKALLGVSALLDRNDPLSLIFFIAVLACLATALLRRIEALFTESAQWGMPDVRSR